MRAMPPTPHRAIAPAALVALVTTLLLTSLATAQTPVTVSFDPPAGSFECEDTLVVEILVDAAATDLRGFSLQLQYDPTVIEPIAITAGGLLTGAACDHFLAWLNPGNSGTIEVDGAAMGCSVAGPGAIVRMEFAGVADGTSPLACLSGVLRTGLNDPIAYTCVPGTIQYVCPVSAEATTWGSLKAVYR
jgi:hypothetical protein